MIIENTLNKFFGFTDFRAGQKEIISSIIDGENVLAVLPTGGGKSLCYQIPALESKSFAIIISPLIALMKDQVDSLNKKQEIAAYINSSLDYSETEKVLSAIHMGKLKLLYVSPEKLGNVQFSERLKSLNPEYLFIDEAHCISEWGHNFRPSYRKIHEFKKFIGIKKVAAFTATATKEVRNDILSQLSFENPKVFIRGFARTNLSLNVEHTKHKKEKTLEILNTNKGSSIIYTSTRKHAEELTEYLKFQGIKCEYYHAGITSELRRIIQDDFLKDNFDVIIATNAFGMGIDKQDIRTIIHYNIPSSIENYYQEIGRAGRDGIESNIYLLFDIKDKYTQDFFIKSSFPTRDEIDEVYEMICDFGKVAVGSKSGSPIVLTPDFFLQLTNKKINDLKFNSIITILNEAGHFALQSEYDKQYYFRFIVSNEDLKAYVNKLVNKKLRKVIITMLKHYGARLFTNKISVSPRIIGQLTELPTDDIAIQLETLANLALAHYEQPNFSPTVEMLATRVNIKNLIIDSKVLTQKLNNSKSKLDDMINYAFNDDCRFKYILNYFGEDTNNYKCGKCDICLPTKASNLSINDFIKEKVLDLLHEAHRPLQLKYLTKILMGKSNHLSDHNFSTFGSCEHYNKDEITHALYSLQSEEFVIQFEGQFTLSEKGKNIFTVAIETPEAPITNFNYDQALELFNKLRQVRKSAADRFSQPINYICSDDVLRNISRSMPVSQTELMSIEGFTNRMYNKFGDAILSTVEEFKKANKFSTNTKNKIPENISSTLTLIEKGYNLKDLAKLTKLPEAVVSMQVESILQYIPQLSIETLFEKNIIKKISEVINENEGLSLKEIKTLLPNVISYAEIRIVKAKITAELSS